MFLQSLVISWSLLSAAPAASPRTESVATPNPPMRAVRISAVEGAVRWSIPSDPTAHIGRVNDVLSEGDVVDTLDDARAELHLGLVAVRVAPRSRVTLKALTDDDFVVQLDHGSISAEVTRMPDKQHIELTAEGATLLLHDIGAYRISLDPNAHRAGVMVREGKGTLSLGTSHRDLGTNTSVQLSRTDAPVFADATARDAFDAWCDERTEHGADGKALKFVSRDVVGWEDLDAHGNWISTDDGPAWQPSEVSADWAPYTQGQWEWSDVYGWTWVDDAAWGYAPSHYGRWGYYGDTWAWVPGPAASVAVYSPALVAFMNINAFADGLIATWAYASWFPLAPGEPYLPGYHTTEWYIAHMNQGIALTITPGVNRAAPHAVVTIRDKVMQTGAPVAPARQALSSQARQYAPATGGFAAITPREVVTSHASARSAVAFKPAIWAVARRTQLVQTFRASAAQPLYRSGVEYAPRGRNYAAEHWVPPHSSAPPAAAMQPGAIERPGAVERPAGLPAGGFIEHRGNAEQPRGAIAIPHEVQQQVPQVRPSPVVPRSEPPHGAIPLPRAFGGPHR